MNRQLLDLLVCPKSKKKLELARPQIIDAVNTQIKAKKCRDINGNTIEALLEEALFQPEERLLYPVKDEIPVLIYEQAIDTTNI